MLENKDYARINALVNELNFEEILKSSEGRGFKNEQVARFIVSKVLEDTLLHAKRIKKDKIKENTVRIEFEGFVSHYEISTDFLEVSYSVSSAISSPTYGG